MKLGELLQLNIPGVFALINPVDKKIYIGVGVSMLKAVIRLLDDLTTNKAYSEIGADLRHLQFTVLENCDRSLTRHGLGIKLAWWVQKYEQEGYGLYSSNKGSRLRVNTFLDASGHVNVEIVSGGNKRVIVGVFKRVKEADQFVEENYKGNVKKIVYADNWLTNKLLKKQTV